MKILIVTYYGLKESLQCAAESLAKLGYDIVDYPLFRFAHDVNDKKKNYLRHFHETTLEHDPDILIWWCTAIPQKNMSFFRKLHAQRYHILFNWDDPFCWKANPGIGELVKGFNLVAASSDVSRDRYLACGVKEFIRLLPGHSPKVHHPQPVENGPIKYECDVLMCCTNIYESEETFDTQWVNRAKLLDALEAADDIEFHLYGPPHLKERFPRSYQKNLPYAENWEKFSTARINLCTHVTCEGDGYLNERFVTILGSGGLLLVDPVAGLERTAKVGVECLVMESREIPKILDQIRNILNHAPEEDLNMIRFKGNQLALDYFTWDHWALTLHTHLSKNFFCREDYISLHSDELPFDNLDSVTDQQLWEFWLEKGEKLGHSCIKLSIPENFDWESYIRLNTDLSKEKLSNRQRAWQHWITHGKEEGRFCCFFNDDANDDTEISSQSRSNTPSSLIHLIMDDVMTANQWFELQHIFNLCHERNTTVEGLEKLNAFCAQHPKLILQPEIENFIRLIKL